MFDDPILAVAIRAARRAASVLDDAARDIKRAPMHARSHGTIANDADAEAENAIIATLRAAFPQQAIVGRESGKIVREIAGGAAGSRSAVQWMVDPVGGADNFVHGYPHYAVSIALVRGTEVTHAVVLDPLRDELYAAIKGKGAQRNGTPIGTSTCVRMTDALVGAALPKRISPKLTAGLSLFNALAAQCAGLRHAGAGALDLAWVASGRLDGFWSTSLGPWDLAAGTLIVAEAGGRVTDFAGGADFLRTGEVIAAAPGIFNPLRQAMMAARR